MPAPASPVPSRHPIFHRHALLGHPEQRIVVGVLSPPIASPSAVLVLPFLPVVGRDVAAAVENSPPP